MMRSILLTSTFIFFSISLLSAQNITGQWKGEFIDHSSKFGSWGGDKCEYVLELEAKGASVTGYSYTYFSNGNKKYYTICKLSGTYDQTKKIVEVKEYERTKTNVPQEIGNCFQVHKLTFFKKTGGDESLEGNWVPAPNQQGNCGYGGTVLTRRNLKSSFPGLKNPAQNNSNTYSRVNPPKSTTPKTNTTVKKLPDLSDKNKTAGVKPKFVTPKTTPPAESSSPALTKKDTEVQQNEPSTIKPVVPSAINSGGRYEKRSNTVIRTIEIEHELIKVDLYDNGEIDGDSISLFLNGKLLMSRKKLTAQPLTLNFSREELLESNDLVMYAENLGTIPPNTALMIVTDGKKRYEVRITSDLQKSGTIRFVKRD